VPSKRDNKHPGILKVSRRQTRKCHLRSKERFYIDANENDNAWQEVKKQVNRFRGRGLCLVGGFIVVVDSIFTDKKTRQP
jgi:hypothetical protein